MVDGRFYLLPHGIDDGSDAAVKAQGLPAAQVHDEIAAIARHGRVILLVDACRSAATASLPDRSLRAMLTSANVTVFTSCAEKQLSARTSPGRTALSPRRCSKRCAAPTTTMMA